MSFEVTKIRDMIVQLIGDDTEKIRELKKELQKIVTKKKHIEMNGHRALKMREWRQTHKEELKKKHVCKVCGASFNFSGLTTHRRSIKHKNALKNNEIKIVETPEDITEM